MLIATDTSYYNVLIFQKYLVFVLKARTLHGAATMVYKNISL